MKDELYENNMSALKKRAPEFYKKIELNDCEYQSMISVEPARNGSNIISMKRIDGDNICLNSKYNPDEEARRYALQYEKMKETMVFLILGFGNGMIARAIAKYEVPNVGLLFYEPSIETFIATLHNFDITDLIADERISIFVKGVNDNRVAVYLDADVEIGNFEMVYLNAHPKYRMLYPDEYEWCRQEIIHKKKMLKLEINTIKQGTKHFMENPIYNLEYVFNGKLASQFKERFPKDIPAIMVASGPSLDKNIDVLMQAKGRAFIVAVDRAAPYLIDHGIEPDMVVVVDFHKGLDIFKNPELKHIPYAIMTDVNYQVLRMLEGDTFIYSTTDTQLYRDIFALNGQELDAIAIGGSVATFTLSLLWYWGFQCITMVGQDLAWKGTQLYAGGPDLGKAYSEWKEVPGNVDDTVLTTVDFYSYIQWFELFIEHCCQDITVINATEGGAFIKGTKVMPLQKMINMYCNDVFDFKEIFAKVPDIIPENGQEEVFAYLERRGKAISKLGRLAREGASSAKRLITLMERNDFGKEFRKLNKELESICAEFEGDSISEFYSKSIAGDEIDIRMDLYFPEKDINDESIRLYQKLVVTYSSMAEHEEEIQMRYDEMLSRVREKLFGTV